MPWGSGRWGTSRWGTGALCETAVSVFSADLLMEALGITSVDAVDVLLSSLESNVVDLDTLLRAVQNQVLGSDVALSGSEHKTVNLDGLLREIEAKAVNLDVSLAKLENKGITIDSYTRKALSLVSSLDSLVVKNLEQLLNADVAMSLAYSLGVSVDTIIETLPLVVIVMDSLIKAEGLVQADMGAALALRSLISLNAGVALMKEGNKQSFLDALVLGAQIADLDVFAAICGKEVSVAVSDVLLATQNAVGVDSDGILLKSLECMMPATVFLVAPWVWKKDGCYLKIEEGEYNFYFETTLFDANTRPFIFDGTETVGFYIGSVGKQLELMNVGEFVDAGKGLVRVLFSSILSQGRYKAQFVVQGVGRRAISRPIELVVGGGVGDV